MFFVIDEAHCMWGFYFRPSYSELWKLAEFGRPILAMTGTATKRTEDAILKSLRLPADTVVVRQCSNRPNLLYHVLEKKSDGKDALVELIKKEFTGQCGIVYCVERSDTVDIAYRLKLQVLIRSISLLAWMYLPNNKVWKIGNLKGPMLCVQQLHLEWVLTSPMFDVRTT